MADITMEIPDDLESKLKSKERDVGGTLHLAAAFIRSLPRPLRFLIPGLRTGSVATLRCGIRFAYCS
jgi:hypothetical protein